MQYTFRAGYPRSAQLDAGKVGQELSSLQERHGLDAETVLKFGRAKRSPLHNAFTWDDGEAAHQHRLNEARTLIRAVCIVTEREDHPVPVFVYVPAQLTDDEEETAASYQPLEVVVQDEEMFRSALAALQRKLSSAQSAVDEIRAYASGKRKRELDAVAGAIERASVKTREIEGVAV